MEAARLELEARWVSPAPSPTASTLQTPPHRLPPSVFPFTAEHTGAGPGAALHHLACPLALFPPVWSSGSPGWGVTWEPGGRLQHRSRSSLLRRMPVRGEYSIAPKLQVKLGLGLELQAPGSHPGTRA